jgi:hypothetical protein
MAAGIDQAARPLEAVSLERRRHPLIRGACEDEKCKKRSAQTDYAPQSMEKRGHRSASSVRHRLEQYSLNVRRTNFEHPCHMAIAPVLRIGGGSYRSEQYVRL